jgi:cobalamin biosynthesis protein CobT
LTNKGTKAYKKGDFEAAAQIFTAALEKYPNSQEARFNKGIAMGAKGDALGAETTLSRVKFDGNDRKADNLNANVLYSRARIAEGLGDAAMANQQQPNIAEAKKSYEQARKLYADALDLQWNKKEIQKIVNNTEILSQKIKNLPPEQEQDKQNNDENKDNQEQNKDENKENEDKQEQEKQENEQNQDNSQDSTQQNQQDSTQQEQNQDENEQSEQEQQQEQEQKDEEMRDAIMMLEHYADDAKELNRPPRQKAVPAQNGKDW